MRGLLDSKVAARCDWRASGRGWPVATRRYTWEQMPGFYQGLDVLVVPSRVEGIPMPPLEALACGVSVVIPRGVGLLDELPDLPGIERYERGDLGDLLEALERAAFPDTRPDPEALRAVTEPYSVENWVADHARAFAEAFGTPDGAGIGGSTEEAAEVPQIETAPPVERGTQAKRGIYVVAFGEPARETATRLLVSAKQHLPEIPVCLVAAKPLGIEDVFVEQPASDVGGRRAKLRAYELAPAEWQSVLYLDADTEIVGDIRLYFQLVEDGWEFVICKDPHLMDELAHFERRNNSADMAQTVSTLGGKRFIQLNGGAWRSHSARQRDQGALLRALYADPLKTFVLGNEWNTFPKYTKGITTAGLMHYPGEARRWNGLIPGRIDGDAAWAMVEQYEARRRGRR